jgi:hypothetical protein
MVASSAIGACLPFSRRIKFVRRQEASGLAWRVASMASFGRHRYVVDLIESGA